MNKKTRILFIEHAQGFGGSIISLSEMLKGMNNVKPYVLMFQDGMGYDKLYSSSILIKRKHWFNYHAKSRFQEKLALLFGRGVINKMLLLPFLVFEKIEVYFYILFLQKLIKREKIELVYSNNGFQEAAVLSALKSDIPCVLHFRGYRKTPYPVGDKVYDYPSVFFAISQSVAGYLKKSGVPVNKIHTIHNSVEISRYDTACKHRLETRKKLLVDEDALAIGIFGRITEWKGQKEFIEAIKELNNRTQIKFKAFIVGDHSDNDDEYFRNLVNDSEQLVKQNKLEFSGYQSEVENYYAAMDIVVHASNKPEPFGRVVIEGMAAKVAVIGMNEAGPAEVIQDGENGLLVEPRSLDKLVEALIRLCEDKALREKLASNGRVTVLENFTANYIGKKIEAELLKLVALKH